MVQHYPRSNCKPSGDRSFAVAGPRFWDKLPGGIQNAITIKQFKPKLKILFHFYALDFHFFLYFCLESLVWYSPLSNACLIAHYIDCIIIIIIIIIIMIVVISAPHDLDCAAACVSVVEHIPLVWYNVIIGFCSQT